MIDQVKYALQGLFTVVEFSEQIPLLGKALLVTLGNILIKGVDSDVLVNYQECIQVERRGVLLGWLLLVMRVIRVLGRRGWALLVPWRIPSLPIH